MHNCHHVNDLWLNRCKTKDILTASVALCAYCSAKLLNMHGEHVHLHTC